MIASRRVLRLEAVVIIDDAVICNGAVVFEMQSCKRNFNITPLKDEQKEAAVHLLRSEGVDAILPTGLEESLKYQPYAAAKEIQMVRIVLLTTDDVLMLIGEAQYKLVFGRKQRNFWMQNSKICYKMKITC